MNAEQTPVINKRQPIPKARRARVKRRVPPAVRAAADAYKAAYKALYGIPASLKWDGTWIRVQGQSEGVTARRLKEMTTQLQRRLG
jgi:hypothetical protein